MEKKMKLVDYKKAAKDLVKMSGCKAIKVVAVKEGDLKKELSERVKELTEFDFTKLLDSTLDCFADMGLEVNEPVEKTDPAPKTKKKAKVVDIKTKKVKTEKVEKVEIDQLPLMMDAAADLIDVLGYEVTDIKKFKKFDLVKGLKEIQDMANEINMPYEEKGETITPDDKPSDYKPETITFFEANGITVNWGAASKPKTEPKKDKSKKKTEKVKTEPKEKKAPKAKAEPKEKKYSRIDAFCEVMGNKKALTKAEINDQMNEAYGGDPRDQTGNINFMITPLIEFGFMEVKGTGKETTYKLL